MATVEGDRALGRGQFRVGLHTMFEAIIGMHDRSDQEIPLDTGMASVREDARHLLGVLHICSFLR